MKLAELLLYAVLGWIGIGVAGIGLSLVKGRRDEAKRNVAWLVIVAAAYLAILLLVSLTQPQRLIRTGEDTCYGQMCFAVLGVEMLPGLVAGENDRIARVTIQVNNHGSSADAEPRIRAYLLDSKGRRWNSLPGLSGIPLATRIAGRTRIVSQPLFPVPEDAGDLNLVFTRGSLQLGRLVLGDSDSLGHRPAIVPLKY